jgi:hypothetical protein
MEHGEGIKKLRRKIEEKLRQEFTDEKIVALAVLLDVDKHTTQPEKKQQS